MTDYCLHGTNRLIYMSNYFLEDKKQHFFTKMTMDALSLFLHETLFTRNVLNNQKMSPLSCRLLYMSDYCLHGRNSQVYMSNYFLRQWKILFFT
jgi:hypothetical protein